MFFKEHFLLVFSEWSGSGKFPPLVYLYETLLLSWCRQAEWIEETCKDLGKQLGPQLHFMCQEIIGRILGKSEIKTQSCAVTVFLKELTEVGGVGSAAAAVCGGCLCQVLHKLRVYTNFFNNYPTILKTIDKCHEMLPVFRNFLKRHDRTVAIRKLSFQELFLTPSARVEEYVTLLQLKKSLDRDLRIMEAQSTIQSCPNLVEESRCLITRQDVALLSCLNGDIAASLRCSKRFSAGKPKTPVNLCYRQRRGQDQAAACFTQCYKCCYNT
ncbi:hypothetical protein cypCar_00027745 [Cyprinus carpio]|nr:hypothetical protein cypCar_00027745 [Cyprinus carpio]